jgi:hypothetical protein
MVPRCLRRLRHDAPTCRHNNSKDLTHFSPSVFASGNYGRQKDAVSYADTPIPYSNKQRRTGKGSWKLLVRKKNEKIGNAGWDQAGCLCPFN